LAKTRCPKLFIIFCSFLLDGYKELSDSIIKWKRDKKLTFLCMKIARGSKDNLGRPKSKPFEVKDRLRMFIND